jgi:hypothetical protein
MSQEERLLVVTESLGVGGTESHLIRLLPKLAKRGWDKAPTWRRWPGACHAGILDGPLRHRSRGTSCRLAGQVPDAERFPLTAGVVRRA